MFLGIEIGGTKLQIGLGNGDGVLAGLWRGPVDATAGGPGIRKQIVGAVPELLDRACVSRDAVQGIGVGFGGPVDDSTRTVIKSHQIEGWDNFPLADWLGELLDLPAILGNDADVGSLAEALFGAGQGLSPIFYITIGSGIGGGLVIDGEIFRGAGRGAAEIGHLLVGDPDHSGNMVLLEEIASGWSIGKRAQRLLRCETLTAEQIGRAAERGDEPALAVLATAIDALALAVRQVVTLLCPRRIVIGGGVSLLGEQVLFEPLRRRVAAIMFPPFAGCYEIVPAALGEVVVVHGALALARKRLSHPQNGSSREIA